MKTTALAAGALLILAIVAVAVVGVQVAQNPAQSTSSILSSSAASGTYTSTTGASTGVGSSTASSGLPSGSSSTSSSTSIGQSTSATASSSTISQQGSSADFAMMATDPPVVASGVTAATATYSSLAVHTAGDSNATGWVQLIGTGAIDLMSSENVSQTIAAAKIRGGAYDMVRMSIQSASVTYDNKVYAATVASSNITSRLQSDAQVTSSQSAAAIVDLRTFVINAANSSQPQFVFSATAKSTTVPPSATTSASMQVGAQTNLQGTWWVGFQDQTSTNVTVTSAAPTSGSLSLQLKNAGNSSAYIQTIVITPVSASGTLAVATVPSSLSGSAVFAVNDSAQVQASNSLQVAALLGGTGTQCAAGSSVTLSYSGNISLGLGVAGIQLNGVVSGQQYVV